MKTRIQLLCIILAFCFISMNAQIKKSYTTKLPSTTTKKSYSNTNLKNTNYTNYNSQIKNNAKLIPISYSPLVYSSRNLPKEAYAKLESVKSRGISSFSFAPNGGWVIVTKNGEIHDYKKTSSLSSKINSLKQYNRKIKQIVFHPKKSDSWVIVTENSVYSNRIPKELNTTLQSFIRKGKKIQSVSFGNKTKDTWAIVNTDGSFYANNIPDECYTILKNIYNLKNSSLQISSVTFSPSGGWTVIAGGLYFRGDISGEFVKQLSSNQQKNYQTDVIAFTPDGKSWSMIANKKSTTSTASQASLTKIIMINKNSSPIPTNSYTSGDGIKDIRKWALKITLDYFYCDESDDSDKKDDYILNQWVEFTDGENNFIDKIDGRMKLNASKQINKSKQTTGSRYIQGNNIIFIADKNHQFWVKEGQNNRKKIGNYILFEITDKVLFHKKSKFILISSLGEMTTDSGIGIPSAPTLYGREMSSSDKKIDIINLITDLSKLEKIKAGEWNYYGDFEMRKYNNTSKDIYGYVKFRGDDRKAKAMMRFELIE